MRPLAIPSDLPSEVTAGRPEQDIVKALAVASGEARRFCGWQLSRAPEERRYRLSGTGVLWLRTRLLVSLDVLVLDGRVVPPQQYEWDEDGRVELGWHTRSSRRALVSYVHGYADDSAEMLALRGVVCAAAGRVVDNPTGWRSWTTGSESYTAAGGSNDVLGLFTGSEERTLLGMQLVSVG